MPSTFQQRLQYLSSEDRHQTLGQIRHGIEKEGLRVTPDAHLSQRQHPPSLGSSLTHPYITTDYSEALLEFITPVYQNVEGALSFLEKLHAVTYQSLDKGEVIWSSSMPPVLEGDDKIPVAEYGHSNIGQMKHAYRQGLAHRYGKSMQTIAGIHYNFSLPDTLWELLQSLEGNTHSLKDYRSAGYFALIRNFRRYAWLLNYLYGASPALDKSFIQHQQHTLEQLDDTTLYSPWATSLRMSDLGYNNNAQSSLNICYNTLDNYVESLWGAIHTSYEPYKEIGVKVDGHYRQLNTNLLQIENEYYSVIRPKRVSLSGEKPIMALNKQGVEYIEVRSLDLNPFLAVGISDTQSYFLDIFLLYCALHDSPPISEQECQEIGQNFTLSVIEGRRPGLELQSNKGSIILQDWGMKLLHDMKPLAELLDSIHNSDHYCQSITVEYTKLKDSSLTPSAQLLSILQSRKLSFTALGQELAEIQADYFREQPLCTADKSYFAKLAKSSLSDQSRLEESDKVSFDHYLTDYFAQDD